MRRHWHTHTAAHQTLHVIVRIVISLGIRVREGLRVSVRVVVVRRREPLLARIAMWCALPFEHTLRISLNFREHGLLLLLYLVVIIPTAAVRVVASPTEPNRTRSRPVNRRAIVMGSTADHIERRHARSLRQAAFLSRGCAGCEKLLLSRRLGN